MSDEYEAGYIHGSAFACLTVAIEALSNAVGYIDDAADLREALRMVVVERDKLARDA